MQPKENLSSEVETTSLLSNTNVINKLWMMVMETVMDIIDYVMDESIGSGRCDGCDGII